MPGQKHPERAINISADAAVVSGPSPSKRLAQKAGQQQVRVPVNRARAVTTESHPDAVDSASSADPAGVIRLGIEDADVLASDDAPRVLLIETLGLERLCSAPASAHRGDDLLRPLVVRRGNGGVNSEQSLGTVALSAHDLCHGGGAESSRMALTLLPAERFHLSGNVSHDASVSVEVRVAQILKRQDKEAILRRAIEQRDVRFATRRQRADDRSRDARDERARANRARAHRTVMRTTDDRPHSRTTEALPGAPRSGCA